MHESTVNSQREAELAAVREWITRDRDPDQFATMLWERTFVDPIAIGMAVASSATRWSPELIMSVSRSAMLLQVLAARGESAVPVLTTAYDVAGSIAGTIGMSLRVPDRHAIVDIVRRLRFVTLVLDHPVYGEDPILCSTVSHHKFLVDTRGPLNVGGSREDVAAEPTAVDCGSSRKLLEVVEDAIIARRSALLHLSKGRFGILLHEPALRDVVNLISSPRINAKSAIGLADMLIERGMRELDEYRGFTSDLERPARCRTREALRASTAYAKGAGVFPDHWILLLALLSRVVYDSGDGLQLLGHCWRIDGESLLDNRDVGLQPLMASTVWHSLVARATISADELSLQLVARLKRRHPERMPNDQQLTQAIAAQVNSGDEQYRAACLRILELTVERAG